MQSTGSRSGSRGRGGSRSSASSGSEKPKTEGLVPLLQWTRGDLKDKQGTKGTEVTLLANFLKLDVNETFEINQYHVVFDPMVDSKAKRVKIIESLADKIGKAHIFDGMILYSANHDLDVQMSFVAPMPEVEGMEVRVSISRTVALVMNDPQFITIANLLIRRVMQAQGMKQVGRSMFDPESKKMLQKYPIEIWPGYSTGVRMYENDNLLVCAENRHKLIRKDTVFDMMTEVGCSVFQSGRDFETYQRNVEAMVIGATVLMPHNNQLHRVDAIDWKLDVTATFSREGVDVRVDEYMEQQYGIKIKDKGQPLLVSNKRSGPGGGGSAQEGRIFLVPELCYMTGLTDKMRGDRRLMRTLADQTRMLPEKRIGLVREFTRKYSESPEIEAILKNWGMSMGTEPIRFKGRQLPFQKIICAAGRETDAGRGEWAQGLSRCGPYRTVNMDDETWCLIYPEHFAGDAHLFYNKCRELGNRMRMNVGTPVEYGMKGDSAEEYASVFEQMLTHARQNGKELKLVVCVLPNDNKTRYDALKKIFCVKSPVPSQMIRAETINSASAKFNSVVLKVLLQMNCKMGGALWKVNIPMKRAIIIGYDLYHDSTQYGKTVGAAVSSYDSEYTRWFGQCALHSDIKELGNNLSKFVRESVLMYHKFNNELPDRILIYRDGCGDGQIPHVVSFEVPQVKKAMEEAANLLGIPLKKVVGDKGDEKMRSSFEPRIAFTVVSKKIDVRFFRVNEGDGIDNPPFGTVVDNTITRPERFDFYLVPQAVNQGTVAPVNYNVVYDSSGLDPNQHQLLAYKLCHLYYNWQGTIRVPSPCQYAHKLAFLVAQSIHTSGDISLADKLYFL